MTPINRISTIVSGCSNHLLRNSFPLTLWVCCIRFSQASMGVRNHACSGGKHLRKMKTVTRVYGCDLKNCYATTVLQNALPFSFL